MNTCWTIDARVSLEWAGRHAEPKLHAVGSSTSTPLPTAAWKELMSATAAVHELEIISSKAEVIHRSWGAHLKPWLEDWLH